MMNRSKKSLIELKMSKYFSLMLLMHKHSYIQNLITAYRILELVEEKKSNEDDEGFIYNLHDKAREILSEYNDTLKGRCAICLENFEDEEGGGGGGSATQTFTDRADLVRID